jgi:Family of unknown function (DUF6166)
MRREQSNAMAFSRWSNVVADPEPGHSATPVVLTLRVEEKQDVASRRYVLTRTGFSAVYCQVILKGDRQSYSLPHCHCYSTSGLNCGYRGSGPTDLAVSILADHFAEDRTLVEQNWKECMRGARSGLSSILLCESFRDFFIAPMVLGIGESEEIVTNQIEQWRRKFGASGR